MWEVISFLLVKLAMWEVISFLHQLLDFELKSLNTEIVNGLSS